MTCPCSGQAGGKRSLRKKSLRLKTRTLRKARTLRKSLRKTRKSKSLRLKQVTSFKA